MFDKTRIDFFWRTAPFAPVEHKFRSHRVGKSRIDAGLLENVEGILIRLPVFTKGCRRGDLKCRGESLLCAPSREGVLSELGIDIASALRRQKR